MARGWVVGQISMNSLLTTRYTISGDKAVNVSGFDAAVFIDGGGAFADIGADIDPGTGEVRLGFGAAGLTPPNGVADLLFLRVGNTAPGLYYGVRDELGDTDILITAIAAANIAATYAVSASGSTLTVTQNGSTLATVTLTGWYSLLLARPWLSISGTHDNGESIDNFTANGGAVTDSFNRPDSIVLGHADSGQLWQTGIYLTSPTTFAYTPTDVTGLIWWLDADAITGLANLDPVATWPDSAGSNDATQSTSASRPDWVQTWLNSHAAVDFDGSNDYLTTALSRASGDLTVYIVCSQDSTSVGNYLFDTQTGRLVIADNASSSGGYPGWYDGAWHASAIQQKAGACLFEYNLASGAGVLYRNGLSVLSAAYTQQAIGGSVTVACSYDATGAFFDGRIAEVVIYDRALGSTDRTKIETYMHEKYGFVL